MGRKVNKKWGHYEVLGKGPGWKVKRLVLEPGKATSPHYHEHRTEQWTVVVGSARVFTCIHEEEYVRDIPFSYSLQDSFGTREVHQLGN